MDPFDILKYIGIFYLVLFAVPTLIGRFSYFSLSYLENISYFELHEYLVAKDYVKSQSAEIRFWGKAYEFSGFLNDKVIATIPFTVVAYAGYVMFWVLFRI